MTDRQTAKPAELTRKTAQPAPLYDAAVVGGGPAGAAAAGELAQSGARVILLEKAKLPRAKTCGGGILARTLAMMPADIRDVVRTTCRTVELTIGTPPYFFTVSRPQAVVCMMDRRYLDSLLVAAAGRCGADIVDACSVDKIVPVTGGLSLTTGHGVFKARFVIAADGVRSRTARKCGWPAETRRLIPALAAELRVSPDILNRWCQPARVRFDFGAVPRGYGWIFPKADRLGVGVLNMQPKTTGLKRALYRYLELSGFRNATSIKIRGDLIPVSPRRDGFVKGRVLLAGDAAGFADPLTAEGITHALFSGRLAARALVEGGFAPVAVCKLYHAGLQTRILPELRIARFFARRVFFHPRTVDAFFGRWGQEFVEGVTDIATGKETYRSLLCNPRNHFNLLLRSTQSR